MLRKSVRNQDSKESMLATNYNELLVESTDSLVKPLSSSSGTKRIVIVATGSRGELQPYIAVGLALKARGYNITIATEARVKNLVEEFQLDYAAVYGDSTGAIFEPSAQQILRDGSMMKLIKLTEEWDKKYPKELVLASMVTACTGADLIMGANLTLTATYCVAEYLNVPWVPMTLGPTFPTSEFPIWLLEGMLPSSCLYKWSYNVLFKMLWKSEAKFINPFRKSLGLPEINNERGLIDIMEQKHTPTIIACSTYYCGPKHAIPADYPHYITLAGFVFVPPSTDDVIPNDLKDFVSRDPMLSRSIEMRPLVYFGFGSMPAPNPVDLVKLTVDTCRLARCRAVLVAGWSELHSNAECVDILAESLREGTIMVVKSVPHDWLFPKTSCIIHHCGVGTMAAALRAGVPQIPCPFMLDQPHNGKLVISLGCALQSMPFNKLTAKKLADNINQIVLNKKNVKSHAAEVGRFIREESESAVDKYCDVIEAAF